MSCHTCPEYHIEYRSTRTGGIKKHRNVRQTSNACSKFRSLYA